MADTKASALTELTAFDGDEEFYVVDDDDGTPVSKRVTIENLTTEVTDGIAEAIADGDASTLTSAQTYADGKVSNAAYDATSWNGDTTHAPSKDAVRDKIESLGSASVDDTAYDATSWNGVTTTAPSKNAVRDKFETLRIGTDVQAWDADLDALATAFARATASGPASLAFLEDTDNGTNKATLIAPASMASDRTLTLPDATGTLSLSDDPGTVLAVKLYEPASDAPIASVTSSTFADVDATNAVITFTVPTSGKVLVEASALCRNDTQGGTCRLNLRESTSDLAGTDMRMSAQADTANQDEVRGFYCAYVTGLTPGASKTYKLGIARDGTTGAAQVRGGPGLGPLIMKVIAAP